MALGKDTKRIQFTLNPNKSKDKVIIDYLEMCYNPNEKVKELLYMSITQGEQLLTTVSSSKQLIEEKIDCKSENRLLTLSNSDKQLETPTNTNSNERLLTESNSDDIEKVQKKKDLLKQFM